MGDHSSGTALADRLARPTRMEHEGVPVSCETPIPIRSCSRRGLPCHPCHQERGGLLPHPFTLTPKPTRKLASPRRFAFCGAIPRVCGCPHPRADVIRRLAYVEPGLSSSKSPCQRSPSRPIERALYQTATERAIPPVSEAETTHLRNNCAWLWPVQVGPIRS